ncbi:MAG: amidohydrolase family protein [Clostridia bacterium]|nr:amidohydrolase family protein [Clostridia bacterium]
MEGPRIFDFHLHPGYDFHGNDTDREAFIAALKKDGLCGAAGSFINLDMYKKPVEEYGWRIPELNRKAWEWHEAYPDFFVPGIHVHPDHLAVSGEEMEKHKARGGVLVGEIVYYMMGFRYDHPKALELFAIARDLGLTVNLHPSRNMETNRALIRNLPGLRIVLAHLGGYGLYEAFLEEMRRNERICADFSAFAPERPGMLRDAVNRVGSERILYGTDYPALRGEGLQKQYVDYVLSEHLSPEATENILARNAERLLGL